MLRRGAAVRGRRRDPLSRFRLRKTCWAPQKPLYGLLKNRGFQSVGSHEIAKAAGVSSATLYRWWNSKEEILFEACFEHMKPVMAVPGNESALARLHQYVLRATAFLASEDGAVMARLVTGIR